ncbi:hypothetical protein KY345_07020 [Candidatus Woesearchaeota archaeon]|nr:hypothetical protein [Candidatus Woesearchaeota archaeon]
MRFRTALCIGYMVLAGCASQIPGFRQSSEYRSGIRDDDMVIIKKFYDCYNNRKITSALPDMYRLRDDVMSFQRDKGMNINGVLTKATLDSMIAGCKRCPPCGELKAVRKKLK